MITRPLHVFLLVMSVPLLPLLQGISACETQDEDEDGWTSAQDCDDTDPDTYPGAPERCDGKDNDCDHQVDEGLVASGYPDEDGDGFGRSDDGATVTCGQGVEARGDCDDTDPSVHPGADDAAADGVDQDCGGTAGPEPHIGLSSSSMVSFQAALDAADAGTTLWVGPGTYNQRNLYFHGKAVTLSSTHLAANTIVDANGTYQEVPFVFTGGEGPDSVLDGFTITGGYVTAQGTHGAGILMNGSSPTIRNCVVTGNYSVSGGGGVSFIDSAATLENCVISGNTGGSGGGIYLEDAAGASLRHCVISGNVAPGSGGAAYVYGEQAPLFEHCILTGNRATRGGALYVWDGSQPRLQHCVVTGNVATREGGGVWAADSDTHVTIVSSILAQNVPYNLELTSTYAYYGVASATVSYSVLYSLDGLLNHNLSSLDASNLTVDPTFVSFSNDGDPSNDDLHLAPGSPAIDAGDPAEADPDGTRADMGAYGGVGSDQSYYVDADGDGLYDGWEAAHGLDRTSVDAEEDPDGDGASNAQELSAHTDPQVADSDGDGVADGAELAAGSSPVDWYSQAGIAGVFTATVPADFSTVQEAIDHISTSGDIALEPGTYVGGLRLEGRVATLRGLGDADVTLLTSGLGSAITITGSMVHLEDLTITGGSAYYPDPAGGGLSMAGSGGTLERVVVTDNSSEYYGGGLYLYGSSPALIDCEISRNRVEYGDGGGLYLEGSSPSITDCLFEANDAAYEGGAVYMEDHSAPVFTDSVLRLNTANTAGGVAADTSEPVFDRCTFQGNETDNSGGAVYSFYSTPTLQGCLLEGNIASYGGAVRGDSDGGTLTNCIVRGNTSRVLGGGAYLGPEWTIDHCTFVDNHAGFGEGGALYVAGSDSETDRSVIQNSILAYNAGTNLHVSGSPTQTVTVRYCDLYSGGGPNTNVSSLDSSNLTVAPGFVTFWNDRDDSDDELHLAPGSPLIDAGDPADSDPDGSRADIGAYGGSGADISYTADQDGDGLYDGWELAHGLDPEVDDSAGDGDGDGLSNAGELEHHGDPWLADTDSDGVADGTEAAAGAGVDDWYSRPGLTGPATAAVPDDFDTVAAAVDAIQGAGTVVLSPGTHSGDVVLWCKDVALRGEGGADSATLQAIEVGIQAMGARLDVSGMTLSDAAEVGIEVAGVELSLSDMAITGNGTGVQADYATVTITRCTLSGNGSDTGPYGGALGFYASTAVVTESVISGNHQSYGGGLEMSKSSVALDHCRIEDNSASYGGGVYAVAYSADPAYASSLTLDHCTLSGNTGGGLYLEGATATVTHSVLVNGDEGIVLGGSYAPTELELSNAIVAYNSSYNLYLDPEATYAQSWSAGYTDFYAAPGGHNLNIGSIGGTNLTLEPGFLSYDSSGLPADLHLVRTSALVDAGDPGLADVDGSRSDPGPYGGAGGDGWDLDGDGRPDWFWPGTIEDVPEGFDRDDFDADDLDPSVY